MKRPIARTSDGVEILLTVDHPTCAHDVVPCLSIGDGSSAAVFGNYDCIETDKGFFDGARLVIEWMDAEVRSKQEQAMAIKFLMDCAEHL